MKRGRKANSEVGSIESVLVKSTILLDKDLKQHLAVASIVTGREQSEIVRAGLKKILREMGCNLDAPPDLPKLMSMPLETI